MKREATPPDPSPYRPPALLEGQEPLTHGATELPQAGRPPLLLPLGVSAGFTAVAIMVHLGLALSGGAGQGTTLFVNQLYLLAVLLTLFTLGCLGWYVSQSGQHRRSTRGNLLLVLLVPAIALLNFVPAFLAVALVVFTLGYSLYLMFLPLGGAYFAAAEGISRWMWWWFSRRR